MTWKVVDLFSGAGGMSHGFWRYPDFFGIVGAVDLERGKPGRGRSPGTSTACNPAYARNIGVTPRNADISELSPGDYRTELGLDRGELDVLISCAPCTGFSQKNITTTYGTILETGLLRGRPILSRSSAGVPGDGERERVVHGNQRHHFDGLRRRLEDDLGIRFGRRSMTCQPRFAARRVRACNCPQRRTGDRVPPGKAVRTVRDAIGHLPLLKPVSGIRMIRCTSPPATPRRCSTGSGRFHGMADPGPTS